MGIRQVVLLMGGKGSKPWILMACVHTYVPEITFIILVSCKMSLPIKLTYFFSNEGLPGRTYCLAHENSSWVTLKLCLVWL